MVGTDRKSRILINLLVNWPSGSMIVKSVNASAYMKDKEKFEGEKNVMHVVTNISIDR